MKRFTSSTIALLLCMISVFTFTACSSAPAGPAAEPTSTDALATDEPDITEPDVTDAPDVVDPTQPSGDSTATSTPSATPGTQTAESYQKWTAAEFTFESKDSYKSTRDVLSTCVMDAIFTSPTGKKLTVPAFWDGDNIWRVRFAPNEIGNWTYATTCAADSSLNGKTGKFACVAYKGNLDIYKHGFLKTETNTPCFLYDDGTPFFYLGDTHWSMASEEYYSAGPHVGNLNTDSHFKYIVDKRVDQKFTVYQSQPIGVTFDLSNGFNRSDIKGLQAYDLYVKYIAEKGLVHTNAMLFFSSEIVYGGSAVRNGNDFNYDYLEQISRYWVARFSAYPIMWTMAQEVDDDYYFSRPDDQKFFDAEKNPWKRIAEFTHKYDPYKHPLTAHMEGASTTDPYYICVSKSSFRNVAGHSWYAIQTNFSDNFSVAKDAWASSQGKVLVLYEGRYENLWTANYGARVQGWFAYLNGMFGYGYGAQDIWYYNSAYGTSNSSNDGFDTISIADKKVKWSTAVDFKSCDQLTYMRDFFEKLDWWKLRPDFNNKKAFNISRNSNYACAADGNNTYVGYLYAKDTISGSLLNMDKAATYTIKWFNPRTNEYTLISSNASAPSGSYTIPAKPTALDWVILATKN